MDCIILTGQGKSREVVFLKSGYQIGSKAECEGWIMEQRAGGNRDEFQISRLLADEDESWKKLTDIPRPKRSGPTDAEKATEEVRYSTLTTVDLLHPNKRGVIVTAFYHIAHDLISCGMPPSSGHLLCWHAKCPCGGYAHLVNQATCYRYWHCMKCGKDFTTKEDLVDGRITDISLAGHHVILNPPVKVNKGDVIQIVNASGKDVKPSVTVTPPLSMMPKETQKAVLEMAGKAADQLADTPFPNCLHSARYYCLAKEQHCPDDYMCSGMVFKSKYVRDSHELDDQTFHDKYGRSK